MSLWERIANRSFRTADNLALFSTHMHDFNVI